MGQVRIPNNIKLRPGGTGKGRTPEAIYGKLIDDYLATKANWPDPEERPWMVVPGTTGKRVQTLQVMLNERLTSMDLRKTIKVRLLKLTEEDLTGDNRQLYKGYKPDEEGVVRAVILEGRDQEKDPYDPSEQGTVKNKPKAEKSEGAKKPTRGGMNE
jgi:hypothetical protein